MYTDVFQPMFIHFFLIIALAHFMRGYVYAKKVRLLQQILIGLLIGAVQIVVMLLPVKIGASVTFDPSTILVMFAFGFFGHIAGFITLAITLITYVILRPTIFWLGLIPYIFATIAPFFLYNYITNPKSRLHPLFVYILTAFVNSLILFAVLLSHQDVRDNLLITIVALFVSLPIVAVLASYFLYEERIKLRDHQDIMNRAGLQSALINAPQDMEIFAVDYNFNYLVFNDYHVARCASLFGETPKIGNNILTQFSDERIRKRLEASIARGLSGETFEVEVELEGQHGLTIHDFYNPIINNKNEVIGVTIISYEITARKQYERNIQFFSYHDKLTGLYNRRYFDEYVDGLAQTKQDVYIVYSDINGLKIMNDVFGHDYGDELLKTVAKTIQGGFGEEAITARTGGDEIITIIENSDSKQVAKNIKAIRAKLLEQVIMGIEVSVSFSEPIKAMGEDIYHALQLAEDSMYLDKQHNITRHQNNVIDVVLNKINLSLVNPTFTKEMLNLVTTFAHELKLSDSEIRHLHTLTNLRIVGNVVLEDNDFYLTDKNERTHGAIRENLMIAYRLILINKDFNLIAPDLTSLHENFDGSGLPRQLEGREIPFKARILRIITDYLTILYESKLTKPQVISELKKGANIKYDPTLLEAFIAII